MIGRRDSTKMLIDANNMIKSFRKTFFSQILMCQEVIQLDVMSTEKFLCSVALNLNEEC